MATTIHQRLACWASDYTAVSDEWWKELYDAGVRVAVLQLQDARDKDGQWVPVTRKKVDALKAIGLRVWGAIRPSGNPLHGGIWTPEEAAEWFAGEKLRLGLQGKEANFEQEVQKADLAGTGWSDKYTARFRTLCPTLPAQLVTYPVEGLNHAPYIARGFRVSVETFSPTRLWEWSPAWISDWCQRIGWAKGRIKVCVPVHTIDGARSPIDKTAAMWKGGGEIGGTLYPINQAMPPNEYLVPLVKALIDAECAR